MAHTISRIVLWIISHKINTCVNHKSMLTPFIICNKNRTSNSPLHLVSHFEHLAKIIASLFICMFLGYSWRYSRGNVAVFKGHEMPYAGPLALYCLFTISDGELFQPNKVSSGIITEVPDEQIFLMLPWSVPESERTACSGKEPENLGPI